LETIKQQPMRMNI